MEVHQGRQLHHPHHNRKKSSPRGCLPQMYGYPGIHFFFRSCPDQSPSVSWRFLSIKFGPISLVRQKSIYIYFSVDKPSKNPNMYVDTMILSPHCPNHFCKTIKVCWYPNISPGFPWFIQYWIILGSYIGGYWWYIIPSPVRIIIMNTPQ